MERFAYGGGLPARLDHGVGQYQAAAKKGKYHGMVHLVPHHFSFYM